MAVVSTTNQLFAVSVESESLLGRPELLWESDRGVSVTLCGSFAWLDDTEKVAS